MMRPRVISSCKEAHRFETPRVGCVENGDAVAEHMTNIEVPAVHHNLYAVGTPSDIAIRYMSEAMPDSLLRNRRVLRRTIVLGCPGRCSQSEQRFHIFPAI